VYYTGAIMLWQEVMKPQTSFALPSYAWVGDLLVKPGTAGKNATALQGVAEDKLRLVT
jgi:hypothetical protein